MVVDSLIQASNPVVTATTWQFPSFSNTTSTLPTSAERPKGAKCDSRKAEKIRRPMNAFMVWSQMRRQEISLQNHHRLHNSEISKQLGLEWKTLSETEKKPFQEKAKELRDALMRAHPDYVYRPNRKGRRGYGKAETAPAIKSPSASAQHAMPSPVAAPPSLAEMQSMLSNLAAMLPRAPTVPALQLPYPPSPLQDPRLLSMAGGFAMNPYLLSQAAAAFPFWLEAQNRGVLPQ